MPTYNNKGDYLLVEVSEPYSLEFYMSIIHEVARWHADVKLDKVLIDLRHSEGNPSIVDRYEMGVEIANAWGARITGAVIGPPRMINHMGENTAVNRGARLLATSNIHSAFKYLGLDDFSLDQGVLP